MDNQTTPETIKLDPEKTIKDFANKLISNQTDMEPEFMEFLNDNFSKLLFGEDEI
jgi:hypothetical protein